MPILPRHLPRPLARYFVAPPTRNPSKLTIGIRREDPARIWERRSPLTPDAVAQLISEENVAVLVQNCERRAHPMSEFIKAGAYPHPTLAPAHILIGIKEPPLAALPTAPLLAPGSSTALVPRTHLLFSHTHKGQSYNIPLLARFLAHGGAEDVLLPRLIDYELITCPDGRRTVGFGWFAGVAGVLESLSAVAHHHLTLGVASPFLHTPRPHTHTSLASLRAALRAVGESIANDGTPHSLGPFVIGVTGTGNVSQGCLSMLAELPKVDVQVADLPGLVSDPNTSLHKVYVVHAKPEDYLVHTSGRHYLRKDYYSNPNSYTSEFHARIAPYLTLFLNGAGWAPDFPRLMTNDQLGLALEKARQVGKARFQSIGDISCDVQGGLQFLTHPSTLSEPFYTTRPPNLSAHLPSVQIMAVDILPTSIPLDASAHFSNILMDYLRVIIREYRGEAPENEQQIERKAALERATIARDGKLVGKHAWLTQLLEASTLVQDKGGRREERTDRKKVLMLGSGMVAGPAVDEIAKRSDVELLVASNSLLDAKNLTRRHANARAVEVNLTRPEDVDQLVKEADLVISLLPVPLHPAVAELCIRHRKHLVTASYISPAMKALHERALTADVLLLNEIGLDPGIDHCSAIKLLTSLRAQNKRVRSFTSFCGGLPAPESAEDVPLGYKFSWSPRGVLSAALNGAVFRLQGKNYEITGEDLLTLYFPDVPVSRVLRLEGLANRDSISYADTYNLGHAHEMNTLLRGTLRYPGFADLMHSFKSIGLLSQETTITIDSWASLARTALESRLGTPIKAGDSASFVSSLSDVIPSHRIDSTLNALYWLSQHTPSLPPVPSAPAFPIDLFTVLLAHKLRYEPHERDLVVLSHEVVSEPLVSSSPSVQVAEVHMSSLIVYGTPTASAMSRCVGLPVAFAALQVLDGAVTSRGVIGPTDRTVYENVLARLEESGLGMKETTKKGYGIGEILAHGLAKVRDVNGGVIQLNPP